MPITMTVVSISDPGPQLRIIANLVFSGSYPTGGDTCDLTQLIGQSHLTRMAVFNNLPVDADEGMGGGFDAEFLIGSALNNGKLKIFTSGGTELGAGAYSSGAPLLVASLNNNVEFTFDKLL